MWKPQTIDVYKSWIIALIEQSAIPLSNWESGFIDSVYVQLVHGKNLTQSQAEKLEDIYATKTK